MSARRAAAWVAVLTLWGGAWEGRAGAVAPAEPTPAAAASVAVIVDGALVGTAMRVEGGHTHANVLSAAGTVPFHPDLRLSATAATAPLVVELTELAPPLVRWIGDALDGKGTTHAVRVVCLGGAGAPAWDLTSTATWLTEVAIKPPAPSGAGVGGPGAVLVADRWTVALSFRAAAWSAGGGALPAKAGGTSLRFTGPVQLSLEGLGAVGPLAVGPVTLAAGEASRGAGWPSTPTTIAPLAVTLRADQAAPWIAWAQSGLQAGKALEKAGTLTWLGSQVVVTLKNVGANSAGWGLSDGVAVANLGLYVEDLDVNGDATVPASAAREGVVRAVGGGGARRVGPFELTLTGVETLTTPLTVASERVTPGPRERLLRVSYTLRNVGAEPESVDSGTLSFQAVDSAGAAFGTFQVGSGAELERLTGLRLAPGQTLSFSAVGAVATRPISSVRVTCASDGTSTTFTVAAP